MAVKLHSKTIKKLLWDPEFRKLFPGLRDKMAQFLRNPGCGCNRALYREIARHPAVIEQYYKSKGVKMEKAPTLSGKDVITNDFQVINCSIDELEDRLRRLGPGPKQLAVARFRDQVTVIVNDVSRKG